MKTNALTDQAAEYLAEKTAKQSPATASQYRAVLEGIWLPWCAENSITKSAQATDKVMDRFTAHLKAKTKKNGKPLSRPTLRTYIRAVRVFLVWAEVPKGKYEQPKKLERIVDVLSRQEIDSMEAAALDERDRLIVRVLADTGIRVGELLGLRPEDLRENTHDRQYGIRVIGKGDKQREAVIPAPLFKRLRHYAEHGGPKDCEFIFCGKRRRANGQVEQLTRSGVDQLIRNLAKTAGISRRVWPHLFRHSYVTQMARKQVPMDFVRRQVGHESLSMISEVYSHLTNEDTYDTLMKALRA